MIFPDFFIHDRAPTIRSNKPTVSTESRSLITLSRGLPGHRWELNVNGIVQPWRNDEFSSFLFPLGGAQNVFEYPLSYYGESSAADKLTVALAGIGATSVDVDGVLGIQKGHYFQFAGHLKVYLLTDVVGNTISFYPPLASGVNGGETVKFQNVLFTMFLPDPIVEQQSQSTRHPVSYRLRMLEK